MIPVQLTLQGLYSYQEKQIIDFSKLTAAGLFGIFGTVGSGKSSILEAITFAVYGRTDRLNLSGDNRYYNMMNLKSNELLIDFIFETGREQTAYRATVKGKRNRKKFEDVKTLERTAYQKVNNEWHPIEPEALEGAIGLSYDNFKRTIIIPQGQFQEFLQLGNRDRTQMMKELFNLGKFEFYTKVTSLESKNNAQKQNIEGQLQQLGAVDPEQIIAYQEQLALLDEEIKEQNRKLAEHQQKEEKLRNLKDLTQKRVEAEKEGMKLQEQKPEFVALEKKISRYEQCALRFKHLLDLLKETREKREEREKQIQIDGEKLKTEEVEIDQLEKLLDEMKPAYEKREELKKKAEELNRLLQMKSLEEMIDQEEVRLKKGTDFWNKTVQEVEKQRAAKQQLEGLIKETRDQIPDMALLSTIKGWHIEQNSLGGQLLETEKEIEKYIQQETALQDERDRLLEAPVFEHLVQDPGYADCIGHLKDEQEKIKMKQKDLRAEESHFRVKAQFQAYAEALEEGKPCPLCGSLHHPERFKSEDIREELERIKSDQQVLEEKTEEITAMEKQLSQLDGQQQFIRGKQKELEEKRRAHQQKAADHAGRFEWKEYQREEDLNEAFAKAKQIQAELKEKESALEKLTKQLEQAEKDKERYQSGLEKIKESLTVHRTTLKTTREQLQLVQPENYHQTPVAMIEEEQRYLLKKHARITHDYTENTHLLQEKTKRKNTLSGSLASGNRELEQEKSTIGKLELQIYDQLKKSSFQSVDEVTRILSEPFDSEGAKQKLDYFNDQLKHNELLLEQLQQEIGERVYDAKAHKMIIDELTELKEQITRKNQEQGKIAELLNKLQKDLSIQVRLRSELEKLEERGENIKTMKSLFKASGFVNYISSVYLQHLCNAANDRFFQLTRQMLRLEITPDNNFQIRDFMNGGKVRSVKTLSGGQTFQAALSLALALADNIQKITESNQNFFFLDEGFGSLDKASLNIVFDTLKSLRKENRIVGVISHVEEMQQEIDVHLRIENQSDRGSIIQAGWRG